jgi:hypothetical protein
MRKENISVERPLSRVVKSMQTTWVTGSTGSDFLCFLTGTFPDTHALVAKIVCGGFLSTAGIVTDATVMAAEWSAIL